MPLSKSIIPKLGMFFTFCTSSQSLILRSSGTLLHQKSQPTSTQVPENILM